MSFRISKNSNLPHESFYQFITNAIGKKNGHSLPFLTQSLPFQNVIAFTTSLDKLEDPKEQQLLQRFIQKNVEEFHVYSRAIPKDCEFHRTLCVNDIELTVAITKSEITIIFAYFQEKDLL